MKKVLARMLLVFVAGTAVVMPAAACSEKGCDHPSFSELSTRFLTDYWKNNPDAALAAGRFESAGNLDIPDRAQRLRDERFIRRWQKTLAAWDRADLSGSDRADLLLIENHLKSHLWYLTQFREYEWNPTQYNIAYEFDQVLHTEYAPKATRIRTLIQRLQHVPDYYRTALQNLKRPTPEHTHLAIHQSDGTLQMLDEMEQQAADAGLNASERATMATRLNAARAAVRHFVTELQKLEHGFNETNSRSFRIGKTLYEGKFAADIQSSYSAEQAYQRAVAAKQAMHANMSRLADQLWPKYMGDQAVPQDSLEKTAKLIDKLSEQHVAREDFIPEIRRQLPMIQDWILKHDLLNIDVSKPLIVRETPAYERGVTVASIEAPSVSRPQDPTYYNVSPLDAQTPEQVESTLREYNRWILQILNIHEALPGHYVQLQHANLAPSRIKALFGNGATVEGWAVYAERMMLEAGYGDDTPEMWLMYSKWHLRTICNTILDYSIHVLGMSERQAMDFLTKEAFQTESEARGKWKRAQFTSVQLTSYFSGYSELYEFREQRKRELGDRFNLKQFHEQVLSYGSAPIKVIKQLMEP